MLTVVSLFCMGCPTPGTESMDVRDVNDAAVAQDIKNRILWDSGAIIGKYQLTDPGNQLQPNPDYPSGKIVVIRAATTDWLRNTAATTGYITEIFFGSSDPRKPPARSVAGYYAENSYGQFKPTSGGVPAWITLGAPLSNFGDIESNPFFTREALRIANVDWSALDTDGDDAISRAEAQIVLLIPNGTYTTGYASVRNIILGGSATPDGVFDFGTRPIVFFSLMARGAVDSTTNPIRYHSSVLHEMNHAFFNFPDRYDANSGNGQYDIMVLDRNWMHMTMHDKIKIGWIQPKILNAHLGKVLRFPSSENRKAALILVKPFNDDPGDGPFEYWVVENRNRAQSAGNYDADFPEDGLAVWYVAEGIYNDGHDDVRLVDADLPDQDPDLYNNPTLGALFTMDAADPKRLLIDSNGEWSLLWFQNVSNASPTMTAEF
ncbi:MAG: hypothetical protein HUU46_23780 [Candidatus Hydrogenedentes bacterium]|nr:hypothetical protein [Candidatus Hydrogenedentota bacterium]